RPAWRAAEFDGAEAIALPGRFPRRIVSSPACSGGTDATGSGMSPMPWRREQESRGDRSTVEEVVGAVRTDRLRCSRDRTRQVVSAQTPHMRKYWVASCGQVFVEAIASHTLQKKV